MLQDKVTQLSTDFGCFGGEVSGLQLASTGIQTLSEEICALQTQNAEKQSDPVIE
jgi:hypothetical protein